MMKKERILATAQVLHVAHVVGVDEVAEQGAHPVEMADADEGRVRVIPAGGEQIVHVLPREVDPVVPPRAGAVGVVFVLLPRKQQKRVPLLQDDLPPFASALVDERPLASDDEVQGMILSRAALRLLFGAAPFLAAAQHTDPVPAVLEQRFSVDVDFQIAHSYQLILFVRYGSNIQGVPPARAQTALPRICLALCSFIISMVSAPSIVSFQKDTIVHQTPPNSPPFAFDFYHKTALRGELSERKTGAFSAPFLPSRGMNLPCLPHRGCL